MTRMRMIGLIVIWVLARGAQSATAHTHVDLYCYRDHHIECRPGDSIPHCNLGLLYEEQQRTEAAILDLERVLELGLDASVKPDAEMFLATLRQSTAP